MKEDLEDKIKKIKNNSSIIIDILTRMTKILDIFFKINNNIINNYNINKRNFHKLKNLYYLKNNILELIQKHLY